MSRASERAPTPRSRLRRAVGEAFPRARWAEPGRRYGLLIHRLKTRRKEAAKSGGLEAPPSRGAQDDSLWPVTSRGTLFIDLETLGFLGRPLFLVGVLQPAGPRIARIVQYLARDYAEERDMLRGFLLRHRAARVWVSFNGKSFDLPFLRDRCRYHRLTPPDPETHRDLLREARPVWRDVLPNCRLKTLESHVCGLWRGDDLDGRLVPEAYHDFVNTGDPRDIVRVLRHNRNDLVTLGRLYRILHSRPREESAPAR